MKLTVCVHVNVFVKNNNGKNKGGMILNFFPLRSHNPFMILTIKIIFSRDVYECLIWEFKETRLGCKNDAWSCSKVLRKLCMMCDGEHVNQNVSVFVFCSQPFSVFRKKDRLDPN